MAKDRPDADIDRELEDLPHELRWREWMRRIEAVLFASAAPVPREDLARVVGQGISVDLLLKISSLMWPTGPMRLWRLLVGGCSVRARLMPL